MAGINSSIQQVAKTVKLFINGEFPRTESGRSQAVMVAGTNQIYTHICQASRKDLREAVEAARNAQPNWSGRTAYLRAQILYRMAEMMEGRTTEFETILKTVLGVSPQVAQKDVAAAIASLLYYAGFADKYAQVMAAVNPVSGPFHNFTSPEPVGVVAMVSGKEFRLGSFVAQLAAVVSSGNTLVAVFEAPGAALISELGEIFKTSDLPAGVINLLSGDLVELAKPVGEHMEVDSLLVADPESQNLGAYREMAIENMKRVVPWTFDDLSLEALSAFTEAKTIWHPVGM